MVGANSYEEYCFEDVTLLVQKTFYVAFYSHNMCSYTISRNIWHKVHISFYCILEFSSEDFDSLKASKIWNILRLA